MSAAMQDNGPRDNNERRKVVDRAIAGVLPQIRSWVQERTAGVKDAEEVIQAARSEFANAEMKVGAQGPSILGSPDLTFARLRSIAGWMIADRVIRRDYDKLLLRVGNRILDHHGAEDVTQVTCAEFAAKIETWEPEVLASPCRTFGLLEDIAQKRKIDWFRRDGRRHHEVIWVKVDGWFPHLRGDIEPFGFEDQVKAGDDDRELIDCMANAEDEEQIRRSFERLMGFLNEQERRVIEASRGGAGHDEIAKRLGITTPENSRAIKTRAIRKMVKAKALEDLCDEIAKVLSGRERDAVRACCWSGQGDEEAADRLGTGPEVVRRFRDGVFEKIRREAGVRGAPWDGLTTRVIWAALRLDQSDPAIAEGLGLTLKKVASIKRRALGKIPGEPGD